MQIPIGKAKMSVSFTGGAQTGYGITPALYSTDSIVKQSVIENSNYFKNGKIVLHDTKETDEEEKRFVVGSIMKEAEQHEAVQDNADTETEVLNGTPDNTQDSQAENPGATEMKNEEQVVVDVTDLDDAASYLHNKHGIAMRYLRSVTQVKAKAAEVGVTLNGI